MRRLPKIPRFHSTMLALSIIALYIIVPQMIVIVNTTITDPDTVPDGHARLIQGEGRASRLEWHAAGFLGGIYHQKARVLGGFLITIFLLISALIVLMWWGCWKKADPGLKLQQELTAKYPEFQSNSTPVNGPTNYTVSIPDLTTNGSDAFNVPIPALSEESLNHFPSNLTFGIYTGFTTGVGPRR